MVFYNLFASRVISGLMQMEFPRKLERFQACALRHPELLGRQFDFYGIVLCV